MREWLKANTSYVSNYFIIVSSEGVFGGVVNSADLFSEQHDTSQAVGYLIKRKNVCLGVDSTLRSAVEIMANENIDLLPVVNEHKVVIGVIDHKDILKAYKVSSTSYRRCWCFYQQPSRHTRIIP